MKKTWKFKHLLPATIVYLPLTAVVQDDQSPDNVKFPNGSRHSSTPLGMLSVTHITPVLVLLSVVG